jgi:biopolymer transport protein ExbD
MSAQATEAESTANLDDEMLYVRRRHRGAEGFIAGLNLTAMMDIFTLLLVYLIKVYADAPENITLNDDLRPPKSTAPDNIVPAVSVLISKSAILVDTKTVLKLKDGRIDTEDPATAYVPLAQALTARVDFIEALADRGGSPFNGDLMIIADQDTPYDLISNVLYQAGKARFTSYRLIVQRGGSAPK